MTGYQQMSDYNMPLTLEEHFEMLARTYPVVQELRSVWVLLKKKLVEELMYSRMVFVNYSIHDGSHSRSIIQAIERFLGAERITRLSATDTFMLLVCTYAHDYGMALSFDKIYDLLGSGTFRNFLDEMDQKRHVLEKEDAWAIRNLLKYLDEKKTDIPLNDFYFSILLVIQMYLRPIHWKGVLNIEEDFRELFQGYLKGRFIHGLEGITEICMCHGQSIKEVFQLSEKADGMAGDDFHPRFVATMLRLGDLLDLDNGRFPTWFVRNIGGNRNVVPRLSVLHFRKHEAISHLLITPERIEITAKCDSEHDGYEVAGLVSEWTDQLSDECQKIVSHWGEIAQQDFGRPPGKLDINIFVDGLPYMSENRKLQMRMSQERVMKLLEGTSIYRDKYVGIREMIQNAVDASLLQLWSDIIQNRYLSYGLSKNTAKSGLDILDLLEENRVSIFGNYNINVEVIKDRQEQKVYIVVKDKGIGITPEDVKYISDIGASKEKNVRVKRLMENMPAWLKPSGVFGIGLQSVFQLTDCIEFYTRQHNAPERRIALYSYGKSRGKIEIWEVPPNEDGPFYDNAIPGTNVKIAIEPRKLLGEVGKHHFVYYDPEFDRGDELDMIFAEVSRACEEAIRESKYDYFNVYYRTLVLEKNGATQKRGDWRFKSSYFNQERDERRPFGEGIGTLTQGSPYRFIDNKAYFWDKEKCRCYFLTLRPCRIVEYQNQSQVFLPETVPNLYTVSYKFNSISNVESIYAQKNRSGRLHAGFLNLEILILDDKPMDYLNIDRDRLRDGSIDEEELLSVRKEILKRWCEYFYKEHSSDNAKKYIKARFKKNPEILISLFLVFYQNAPAEYFRRFQKMYQESIESRNLFVGGELRIPITYLWDAEQLFLAEIQPGKMELMGRSAETSSEGETKMTVDVVRHIPHRLVNIETIYLDQAVGHQYCFRLHMRSETEAEEISMNEMARFYDYMCAFDPHTDRTTLLDYYTIQKKVFKPNKRFPHLIVPCYPHTFQKGRNLSSALDYCINWYILSPFDQDSVRIMKLGIEKLEDVRTELKLWANDSIQMKKCVRYVLEHRFGNVGDPGNREAVIKREYWMFVEDFYNLIFENRELLRKQFLEKDRDMGTGSESYET